jgi:predicted O-methyltransferase YrrM
VTLLELIVIAKVVASVKPRVVLEIGTFDGRTTLNLAANASGIVLTLDLPPDKLGSTELPIDPSDASYIEKPLSGARFLNRPERARITQLFGDSATFDFTPWLGNVDLVFIDGAHSREYVLSDTDRALRLLRPEGGVVLWHDYDAAFDGVTVALDEIRARGVPVQHIEGTSLAIAFVDVSHRTSR